jgi:hypothetical protein
VLTAQLSALQNATDIRVAMAAYARGSFAAPDNVPLQQALLVKALQLGYPEMAYLPAGVLARQNKADGLALSVVAQMQAKAGLYVEALQDMVKAVDADANNDYVASRTAELLAWYDRQPNMPGITDDLHKDLERIRVKIESRPIFHVAYESAKTVLAGGSPPGVQNASIMDQPTTQSCDQTVVQLNNDVRRLHRTVDQLRTPGRNIGSQFYGSTYPNMAAQIPYPPSVPPPSYPPPPSYNNNYVPPSFSPNQGYLGVPYSQPPFFNGVVVVPESGGRER